MFFPEEQRRLNRRLLPEAVYYQDGHDEHHVYVNPHKGFPEDFGGEGFRQQLPGSLHQPQGGDKLDIY